MLIGIDIRQVQEINRHLEITEVPYSPDYVRGVVNLRGQVVTVLDLRTILGLEPTLITDQTRNIIVQADGEHVGLLADRIAEVFLAGDKQLVAQMHTEAGIYIDNARKYVELQDKVAELTDASGPVVQSARTTQKHLELHSSAIEVAEARKGATDTSIDVYKQKTAPILELILGGFTQTLDIDQSDEVGIMAKALNTMSVNFREMVQKIAGNASTVAGSSTELSSTSTQMAAAEEMSVNMNNMAVSTEQKSLFQKGLCLLGRRNRSPTPVRSSSPNITAAASSINPINRRFRDCYNI